MMDHRLASLLLVVVISILVCDFAVDETLLLHPCFVVSIISFAFDIPLCCSSRHVDHRGKRTHTMS